MTFESLTFYIPRSSYYADVIGVGGGSSIRFIQFDGARAAIEAQLLSDADLMQFTADEYVQLHPTTDYDDDPSTVYVRIGSVVACAVQARTVELLLRSGEVHSYRFNTEEAAQSAYALIRNGALANQPSLYNRG